jgi:hypothetical protein
MLQEITFPIKVAINRRSIMIKPPFSDTQRDGVVEMMATGCPRAKD